MALSAVEQGAQKVYTSWKFEAELCQHRQMLSGGLAVTDDPASLGTGILGILPHGKTQPPERWKLSLKPDFPVAAL